MDEMGFNLNASADRSLLAGIIGLVLYLIGCMCGSLFTFPFMLLPVSMVVCGVAVYFGRTGLTEVECQILPPEMRTRAMAGTVLGAVGLVLNLLWLFMCCAGIVVALVLGVTGNL